MHWQDFSRHRWRQLVHGPLSRSTDELNTNASHSPYTAKTMYVIYSACVSAFVCLKPSPVCID